MPPENSQPDLERFLIVNADDFGLTEGINRGIIEAHERGIVTSASMMVRHPAAIPAAEYACSHPDLSIGLHFEAAEWRYEKGKWRPAYQVVAVDDTAAVAEELQRQLSEFERIIQRAPTHLDSHQHVHAKEPMRTILLAEAARRGVPLRGCDSAIEYHGGFYGQTEKGQPFPTGISASRLTELIESLSPGWTEFGCHPGYTENLDSVYLAERKEELRVLCSEEVCRALDRNKVRLRSFRDYREQLA